MGNRSSRKGASAGTGVPLAVASEEEKANLSTTPDSLGLELDEALYLNLLGKLIGVRTAGFLIGPGLGAVVAEFGNNDTPFFVTGVLLLGLAPGLARIAPTAAMPVPPSGPTSRTTMFRRRPTLAAIILTAALVMPVGLYDAIWAILMDLSLIHI